MTTIRLAVDFFDNPKIRHLATFADGGQMILTWLKMLTVAGQLDDEGRVYHEKGKVIDRQWLATLCGISNAKVEEYFKRFKRMRMICFEDDGTLRLVNWQKYQQGFSGSCEFFSPGGQKKEKESFPPIPPYKEKGKNAYKTPKCYLCSNFNCSMCYVDTQTEGNTEYVTSQICNVTSQTEGEDKDVTKQICNVSTNNETNNINASLSVENVDIQTEDKYVTKRKEIVCYLNDKIETKYHYNADYIKRHINAMLRKGFTVEDFKKVIDSKVTEWKGTDMERFLRPQTLFSTNFESYLYYAKRQTPTENNSSFNEDDFIRAALNRKD